MHRLQLQLITVLFLVLLFPELRAQKALHGNVGFSQTIPASDEFNEGHRPGIGATAAATFYPNRKGHIGLEIGYRRFSSEAATQTAVSMYPIIFSAGFQLNIQEAAMIYWDANVGLTFVDGYEVTNTFNTLTNGVEPTYSILAPRLGVKIKLASKLWLDAYARICITQHLDAQADLTYGDFVLGVSYVLFELDD